jgi:uncharacterized protein YuzE
MVSVEASYDPETDAAYLRLGIPVGSTHQDAAEDGTVMDVDEPWGDVVGYELLSVVFRGLDAFQAVPDPGRQLVSRAMDAARAVGGYAKVSDDLDPPIVDVDVAAHGHWERHDYVGAGLLVFDAIPRDRWPTWGASALIKAYPGPTVIAEIDELLDISRDRSRWFEARRSFNDLRKLTLQSDQLHEATAEYALLLQVGENVAKIVYNASGGPAPYDYEAGYRVVESLGRLSELWGDPRRRARAWESLTGR